MTDKYCTIQAALDAGAALAKPQKRDRGENQIVLVPEGYKIERFDADTFVSHDGATDSVNDFIDYVTRFATKNSMVAENLPDCAVAHLDFHEPVKDKPAVSRFDAHRFSLIRVADKDFAEWRDFVGVGTREHERLVSQRDFVEFIDEHINDVTKPEGAKLLDILENIEGRSEVRFNSVAPAAGGTRVSFSSIDEAKAGEAGQAVIPKEIAICVPLFKHGATHELRIRVRVRINAGKIAFALKWLNLKEELENEEESVRATLQGALGKVCFVVRAK